MLLNIEHRTQYSYSEPVNYTIQQLRLTPQNGFGQLVNRWEIKVNGQLSAFEDVYGNLVHTLAIDVPHEKITIIAKGEVETGLPLVEQTQRLPLSIYLRDTPLTTTDEEMRAFAKRFLFPRDQQKALEDMMHATLERVAYIRGATQVNTSALEAFQLGKGVCQDHAHIFVACCRSIGLPARYVSGYLFTEDGSLMQSHAWADVWLQDFGWQSFDVSNGCQAYEVHVRLAAGLDYRSASPVEGMRTGGGLESMGASVLVSQSGTTLSSEYTEQAQKMQQ